MTAPQSSPFQKLCELAQELIRKRGVVDIDVLLVLSDSAQQLGLPKEAVQAAIDSLSGKDEKVDAVPVPNDPDALPTAIPIADGFDPAASPSGSRWQELPEALPIDNGPPQQQPSQEPLIATPVAPPPPRPREQPSTLPSLKPPQQPKSKPQPKPADRYRRWLKQRLSPRKNQSISSAELKTLLDFGVQKAGLTHFYADDILAEACLAHSIELPSSQAKTDDATLLTFIEYCQEVLAIEGGVNVQSRLKMDAKADELKLSPEQREQAPGLLDTKVQPNRLQRRTDSFETFLAETIANNSKVGPAAYQQLQQKADEVFGLDADVAARSIAKIAKQNSIQVITKETASELLDRSIAAVIDDRTILDRDSEDQLLAEGKKIGLDQDHVLQRIESTLELNRERYKSRRQKDRLLLAIFSFVIAGVLVAAGAGAYFIANKENVPPITQPPPQEPASTASPDWWTPDLMLTTAELAKLLPEAAAELKSLESKIAVARVDACQNLIERFNQLAENLDQPIRAQDPRQKNRAATAVQSREMQALGLLQRLLVQTYLVEPDQRVHELWRQGLLAELSAKITSSWREQSFGLLFRKLSMAEEVLQSEQLDAEAKQELVEFLNESIADDPTATGSAENFRRRLTIFLHDQMKGKSTDVDLDYANYRVLLSNANKTMSKDEAEDFRDDLVFQIIPSLSESLGGFESELRKLIAAVEGIELSRFVEIYERMRAGEAQTTLGRLLLAAVHLRNESGRSAAETALAIRQQLLKSPSSASSAGANQLAPWLQRTELMLSQPLAADDNDVALLTQAAVLAQHLAIGEAIVEAERNPASNAASVRQDLDNLGEFTVPATPVRSSTFGSTRISGLSTLYQDRFYQYLDRLRTARDPRLRISALNMVFGVSSYVDDITPELAANLVEYTFTMKPNDEHLLIVQNIGKWKRWKYFELSLADAVAAVTSPPVRAKAMLDPLLGRDIDVSNKNWKIELRLDLLQSARDRFGGSTQASSEDRSIDAAADHLTEVLSLKSRLRGHVPDPQQSAVPTPARAMKAATLAYGQRLSASSPGPETLALIDNANRRRDLAKHVANNDIGKTAALQRAYLRLLAADLVADHPDVQEKASQLLVDLDSLDQNAKSLLVQIRDGELIGMRLLQLRGGTR